MEVHEVPADVEKKMSLDSCSAVLKIHAQQSQNLPTN